MLLSPQLVSAAAAMMMRLRDAVVLAFELHMIDSEFTKSMRLELTTSASTIFPSQPFGKPSPSGSHSLANRMLMSRGRTGPARQNRCGSR